MELQKKTAQTKYWGAIPKNLLINYYTGFIPMLSRAGQANSSQFAYISA
jgi:hypothetical protein